MATLTILNTNATLKTGETLRFSFNGLEPGGYADVSVVGGGGLQMAIDSHGQGNGGFVIGGPPGTYTLEVYDGIDSASAQFYVVQVTTPPPPPAPDSWYPMLVSLVEVSLQRKIAPPPPADAAWYPMLTGLAEISIQLKIVTPPPADDAWYPMLTSIVEISMTPAVISAGWLPMLTSIVSVTIIKSTISNGWLPMLNSIVAAPALKIPGGIIEEKKTNWLPIVVIGGATLAAAAVLFSKPVKKTVAEGKKLYSEYKRLTNI